MRLGTRGLPLRSAVIARRQRDLRLALGGLALGFCAFIGTVVWAAWPDRAGIAAPVAQSFRAPAPAPIEPVAVAGAPRPVYRHSIVPGGAYSQKDVAAVVRRDDVVAAHYEPIDVERVRPVTVTAARAVYVSYRRGDDVYWTKRPVQLTPGETLLTDGTSEIRARCGNRVSDHARLPVAADEPPFGALDTIEPSDSSSMAEARTDPGGLTHIPFLHARSGGLTPSPATDDVTPTGGVPGGPTWLGAGGGFFPSADPSTGSGGSPVTPLGGSARDGGVLFVPPGGPDVPGTTTGDPSLTGTSGSTTGDAATTTGDTGTTTGDTPGDTTTTGTVTTRFTSGDTTTDGPVDTHGDVPLVPEPATLTLLGLGALGVLIRARRRRR